MTRIFLVSCTAHFEIYSRYRARDLRYSWEILTLAIFIIQCHLHALNKPFELMTLGKIKWKCEKILGNFHRLRLREIKFINLSHFALNTLILSLFA